MLRPNAWGTYEGLRVALLLSSFLHPAVQKRTGLESDLRYRAYIGNSSKQNPNYSNYYSLISLILFYFNIQHINRSRDSSVGTATGYGLNDQGEREFESR
jgi:hypothetical protein